MPIDVFMAKWHLIAPYVPLLALLCWAAVSDVRSRLIRNWLTASLIVTGLVQSIGPSPIITPGTAALGLLAGLGLLIVPFALGAVGGGDVKLLAGIGAWIGPTAVFQVFLVEAVIGMAIVVTQAAAAGRLRMLARNSAVLAVNLAHANELGIEHVEQTGRHCRSVDRPLPYAVPTLAATAVVVLLPIILAGGHG
jgi:prepilin peptidase CpaA